MSVKKENPPTGGPLCTRQPEPSRGARARIAASPRRFCRPQRPPRAVSAPLGPQGVQILPRMARPLIKRRGRFAPPGRHVTNVSSPSAVRREDAPPDKRLRTSWAQRLPPRLGPAPPAVVSEQGVNSGTILEVNTGSARADLGATTPRPSPELQTTAC
jgi:hypothetical protein